MRRIMDTLDGYVIKYRVHFVGIDSKGRILNQTGPELENYTRAGGRKIAGAHTYSRHADYNNMVRTAGRLELISMNTRPGARSEAD